MKQAIKNSVVITLILLFATYYAKSNETTIIQGKIANVPFNNAYLRIEKFDTITMENEESRVNGNINDDGTFFFTTNQIKTPFTICWLHLGNEYTHFHISPGDSVYVEMDALRFDESIYYSGKNAGQFNYRRDYFLRFWDSRKGGRLQMLHEPEKFIPACTNLKAEKKRMLYDYFNTGNMDTTFFIFENRRISYEYYQDLLIHFHDNRKRYINNVYLDSLARIVDSQKLNNSKDFYLYEEYRSFLKYYPDFYITTNKYKGQSNSITINDKIEFAENNLEGPVLQYYVKTLIPELYSNRTTLNQALALLNYLDNKFNDPIITRNVRRYQSIISNNRLATDFLGSTATASIILVIIILIFLAGKRIKFKRIKNPAKVLIVLIYGIIAISLIALITDSQKETVTIPVIAYLVFFFTQVYIFLPKFLKTLNKSKYILATGLSVLLLIAIALILKWTHPKLPGEYDMIVYAICWSILTLIAAWICNKLHFLIRDNEPLKKFFNVGEINQEYFLNAILLFIAHLIFIGATHWVSYAEFSTFYMAIILYFLYVFWIVPNYLFKKQFKKLAFILAGQIVVIAAGMLFMNSIQDMVSLNKIGISYKFHEILNFEYSIKADRLLASLMMIIPAIFYNTTKNMILKNNTEGFRLYRKKEAELQHLRSQVNPHFLFNSLNTLYAYALKEENNKTAEPIAKLANLMRYMIDDMDKETIPLKKEVAYIEDYIKLQSIRSAVEHDIDIHVNINCDDECCLAPMLFIPFVENAFKHGINPNKKSILKLEITGNPKHIQFYIENSTDPEFKAFYKEKGFGIGIENVKRRLEHIYPGTHEITVTSTQKSFIVIVKIEL